MQNRNLDLRAMLLEVYKTTFGHLPEMLMETEEVFREVIHRLSHHHTWPKDLNNHDLLSCLIVAREELPLDEFLTDQAREWVEEQLTSIPPNFNLLAEVGEVHTVV
ncbi:MAG: hypothetical protein AAB667_01940 [Patescibacteria group bacterium]